MKIMPIIKNNDFRSINFQNNKHNRVVSNSDKSFQKSKDNKMWYILGGATGVCAISLCGVKLSQKNRSFHKILADELSKYTNKSIKAENLKSVMTYEEFLSEISVLKPENFVASEQNIENGIFCADLHSHTNYSDGQGTVENILDGVADYANKLYLKTKKKFIFAITDHNGVNGVKEALSLIGQNPEKYKNVRFVTGAELSFVMPCEKGSLKYNRLHNQTECAEVLVYGINPFSKNVNNYFNNLYTKREQLWQTVLSELNSDFKELNLTKKEADNLFRNGKDNLCMFNNHWGILNYAQIKNKAVELSKETQKPLEFFLNMIKENQILNPYQFDEYLKHQNINTSTQITNEKIDKICKKHFPHIEQKKIFSLDENTFEELISAFSKEKNVVFGFAHPAFLFENINEQNIPHAIENYINASNGKLKISEKYHQAYNFAISRNEMTQDFIDKINNIIDKYNLLFVGGRDNHTKSFL